MAKVSELIEQARALEAQGESAKALAIYQHVLPHLEGMPAIKADLSLKAGDLFLKLGNTQGALGMYDTAGAQCALHGSTRGVLTVAGKILQAAPQRSDVYLSLAGQMVKHGHAGPAVDVLIAHARHANLPSMLQELQPLQGRPSEDVRPLVEMLLDQPADLPKAPAPATASPPPAPRPAPPPSRPAPEPPRRISDEDLRLETASLEDQLAAMPQPRAVTPPPAPNYQGPPPPPAPPPSVPSFASTIPPAAPPGPDITLDVSPPLPPTPRETAQINLRASQVLNEVKEEEVSWRASGGIRRPSMPVPAPGRKSGALAWLMIAVILLGGAATLAYFGVLPASIMGKVRGAIPALGAGAGAAPAVASRPDSTRGEANPAPRDTAAQASPPVSAPAPAPAPAAPLSGPPPAPEPFVGRMPPVHIQGLAINDFTESATQFRVIQRQAGGQLLTITGRPLADTIGEPAVGEVQMDSLPGDTSVATTNFEGYLVTVRGIIAPAALQSLLLQLVARPAN